MSNLDDFDAPPQQADAYTVEEKQNARSRLSEALKTNPAFKIFLILVAVGALASAAMGVFSGGEKRDNTSMVRPGSNITSTPGGEASPAFQQAVQEASRQRAEEAAQSGASALPTPLGGQTQITTLDPSENPASNDPLSEFRATQIDDAAPRDLPPTPPPAAAFDPIPQQQALPAQAVVDPNMVQAMAGKIQQLTNGWQPGNIRVLQVGDVPTAGTGDGTAEDPGYPEYGQPEQKILVPAGTINYGQMMVEANSDVPGTVMATIMSGPFAGGKAIGAFQPTEEKLVIRFSLVNFKGKDFPVDILALDPGTTLSGLATEYDPRYWDRVVLPAAADFISGFANAFAQADQNVTIQDGVVVTSRAGASIRQGIGEGTTRAGERLADILDEQGSNIQPLIRVAAGTPIGLFFTQSVYEEPQQNPYGQGGYGFAGGAPGYNYGYGPYGQGGGFGGGNFGPGGFNGLNGIVPGSTYGTPGVGSNINYGQGGFSGNSYSGYGGQQIAPGVSYYGNR